MRLYLFTLIVSVVLFSATYGHIADTSQKHIEDLIAEYGYEGNITELIDTYNNEYVSQVPSGILNIFGSERINAKISGYNVSFVLENGIIYEFSENLLSDPTLELYVSKTAIDTLSNSESAGDFFLSMQDLVKSGEISYSGVGFVSKIKFSIIRTFQGILFRLSGFFS